MPSRSNATPVKKELCHLFNQEGKLAGWKYNDKCKQLSSNRKETIDRLCLKPINVRSLFTSFRVRINESPTPPLLWQLIQCGDGCQGSSVPYPRARSLLWQLYSARKINETRTKIDERLFEGDHKLLLDMLGISPNHCNSFSRKCANSIEKFGTLAMNYQICKWNMLT